MGGNGDSIIAIKASINTTDMKPAQKPKADKTNTTTNATTIHQERDKDNDVHVEENKTESKSLHVNIGSNNP